MPSLPQLLGAARYLSGLSYRDLYVRTGVREGRAKRILNGATRPTPVEVVRLLRAVGIDHSLLTSPHLLKGRGERYGPIAALLSLQERTDVVPRISLGRCRLTIDKLSVTFEVRDTCAFVRWLKDTGERGEPDEYYQHTRSVDGARVNYLPRTGGTARRYARVEFNPSARTPTANLLSFLRKLLRHVRVGTTAVTRVDVAVDVPASLHDLQVVVTERYVCNYFVGPTGVETINFVKKPTRGGSSSRRRAELKTYNKARQLHQEDRVLTRFEATVKNPRLRGRQLQLDELAQLKDPFKDLHLAWFNAGFLPLSRRLLVEYARYFGNAALRAELSAAEFERLVRDMEASHRAPLPPHPSELFNNSWRSVVRRLLGKLGLEDR